MSEINSIANGTYIIGQTSATNFIPGPGIKIDQPSAGTVRIGNDETVLWSGVSSISANPHCPVSESPKHFEYVSIFCRGYPTHQPQLVTQIDFNGGASENQAWIVVPAGGANGAAVRLNQFACSANDSEVYSYSARQFSLQGATASTATSPSQITKIVGINRISGSNA